MREQEQEEERERRHVETLWTILVTHKSNINNAYNVTKGRNKASMNNNAKRGASNK